VFKSRLVEALSAKHPTFPRETLARAVDLIQREIVDALAGGGRVEIRGFGSFFLTPRRARVARNPKTGETFTVGAKLLPRFKPGKKLRAAADADGHRRQTVS
jgi:integration host factor subunit beta